MHKKQHFHISIFLSFLNSPFKNFCIFKPSNESLCFVHLIYKKHNVRFGFLLHYLLSRPARMMESMSHEVELRSAEPEIIELLIEFIYTAR